jgi:two-component sensor histidine kinase
MNNLIYTSPSFFTGKKLYIFLHIAGWAILFILPTFLIYEDSSHNILFLFIAYLNAAFLAFVFYMNYLWLVPRFFFRGKKALYFIAAVILIACTCFLYEYADDSLVMTMKKQEDTRQPREISAPDSPKHKPPRAWPVYNFMLNSFLIAGFGLGLRFSEKLIQNEKKRKEAEKEKLNSELAFLKNQISPHFFFNTLNNIYSLVETNTKDAQEAILKLSKLMRYLIYETEQGTTLLSREIEFMKHYIDLMKLRINQKVGLKVDFPKLREDIAIQPLLFIPFIENAFKHGISYRDQSFIRIKMQIDKGILLFTCDNSMGAHSESSLNSGSGIGLENITKRLALLYPGKHTLNITRTDNQYSISLEIMIT